MIKTLENCKDLTDIEIVEKSLEDLDYFSCLYLRYEQELLIYIRRFTSSDIDEARDILQESFIKVWRNLNEFDKDMKFSSWIYRIVHNEVISFIRKNKSFGKNKKIDAQDYEDIIPDDLSAEVEEQFINLYKLLEEVPLKYREVLILKFFEKKSYEEISDILKIPKGTVATRINRAKKKFRDLAVLNSE